MTTALFAEYGGATIGGSRSISDCIDCSEDLLSLSGGSFWRAGVDLVVPTRKPAFSWGFTASYVRYGSSTTYSDEVRIGFSWWWLSNQEALGGRFASSRATSPRPHPTR